MTKDQHTVRIVLEQGAAVALDEMIKNLKVTEQCVKVTASKLVSWIIERYRVGSFPQDEQAIVKAHFNSREYLKKVVQDIEPGQDVAEALEAALQKMRKDKTSVRTQRKRKQSAAPVNETTSDQVEAT